jgi:hypothetical protein
LIGKPERRRPLGKPRSRREDNIRTDPREIGWECVDWMQLVMYLKYGVMMWPEFILVRKTHVRRNKLFVS